MHSHDDRLYHRRHHGGFVYPGDPFLGICNAIPKQAVWMVQKSQEPMTIDTEFGETVQKRLLPAYYYVTSQSGHAAVKQSARTGSARPTSAARGGSAKPQSARSFACTENNIEILRLVPVERKRSYVDVMDIRPSTTSSMHYRPLRENSRVTFDLYDSWSRENMDWESERVRSGNRGRSKNGFDARNGSNFGGRGDLLYSNWTGGERERSATVDRQSSIIQSVASISGEASLNSPAVPRQSNSEPVMPPQRTRSGINRKKVYTGLGQSPATR